MDVVRAAATGEISRQELVRQLRSWKSGARYETTGLADDWELRDNSFAAVEYAFVIELIDENDYEHIVRTLDGEGSEVGGAAGKSPPSV